MTDFITENSTTTSEQNSASICNVCKSYIKDDSISNITVDQFRTDKFFTNDFTKQLYEILEKLFSDGALDSDGKEIFEICSEFFLKLAHNNSNMNEWFNQQNNLFEIIKKCLTDISSYGYYIDIDGSDDIYIKSINRIVLAFECVKNQELLDNIAQCITSRFYFDSFDRLIHSKTAMLSFTQQFLLVTCPNHVLTLDKDKTICSKTVNSMLEKYGEIFSEFLHHNEKWSESALLCILYPIKLILSSIHSLNSNKKKSVYKTFLNTLLHRSGVDQNTGHIYQQLIYTLLCLFIEIFRLDNDLLNYLKGSVDDKTTLITVLQDLSKTDINEKIKLKAIELNSLLQSEEEFFKQNTSEQITETFVKNFSEALNDGNKDDVDEVLNGLKDLVQTENIQKEIVKQDGLSLIVKSVKESTDNPLPLEISYAMAFNPDAKCIFQQDREFIDHVKKLRDSNVADVSKIAHGIIWKIEGEEKRQATQIESHSEENHKKHDIMISYCWAQKNLCHKINDRLEKDGYHVWLDRDEMHGSIIDRMAEAIENSKFVLVCMSSNYKNSINCKAEAEYAFSRKSKIVPLIVQSNYKADGWLGFLAGSKIYIEFASERDEQFENAYKSLIAELVRQGLKDNHGENKEPLKSENKQEQTRKIPETNGIHTKEYINVGPPSKWNEDNVKEFLFDHQLDLFVPICESMDGETLIEFHNSCQTMPDKMFSLINHSNTSVSISLNIFFKFISRLKRYLPPKSKRNIYFRYNFIYPPTYNASNVTQ